MSSSCVSGPPPVENTIGEDVMVMLKEALETERERRKREIEETATQREAGRAILKVLTQRLTADSAPNWHFMLGDDAVSVLRTGTAPLTSSCRRACPSAVAGRVRALINKLDPSPFKGSMPLIHR